MTLLFKPRHVAPIMGEAEPLKVETRRLWDQWRVKVGGTYYASTHLYKKEARCARILVNRRWIEPLIAISPESALNEGYLTKEDFLAAFASINGPVPLKTEVRVVRFTVVEDLRGRKWDG